jgi:hypothetical protein
LETRYFAMMTKRRASIDNPYRLSGIFTHSIAIADHRSLLKNVPRQTLESLAQLTRFLRRVLMANVEVHRRTEACRGTSGGTTG